MANKRPPNAEATQFKSGAEAVENGRRGGIASGKKRREKKTVQKILTDFLATNARSNETLATFADSVGLDPEGDIKTLFVMMCMIRSMQEGNLCDLERLMKILGEQKETSGSEEKLDALLEEFKNAVKSETT